MAVLSDLQLMVFGAKNLNFELISINLSELKERKSFDGTSKSISTKLSLIGNTWSESVVSQCIRLALMLMTKKIGKLMNKKR